VQHKSSSFCGLKNRLRDITIFEAIMEQKLKIKVFSQPLGSATGTMLIMLRRKKLEQE